MRKSPRSQENRSGRFRSITTFRFRPLNKLKILLNKSKNFIKANFLVGPCLRKKMMRNLSFDQNWETFFYYIATSRLRCSVLRKLRWVISSQKMFLGQCPLCCTKKKMIWKRIDKFRAYFHLGSLNKVPFRGPKSKIGAIYFRLKIIF